MSPDDVRAAVERLYPEVTVERRVSPDGWAFFHGPKQGGATSNRLIRATRSSEGAPTKLKLAVTSRVTGDELELTFRGNEDELRSLIDREIRLWQTHQR